MTEVGKQADALKQSPNASGVAKMVHQVIEDWNSIEIKMLVRTFLPGLSLVENMF